MITLINIAAFVHVLGAAIGAAGITFGEIFYLKATADGRVDARERDYLHTTFFALRWGLLVILLSGIVLGTLEYAYVGAENHVISAPWWFINTLAFVIIFAGWGLMKGKVSWWIGSSLAFSAWWMVLMLDAWQITSPEASFSYVALVFAYVVFALITAGALSYARFFMGFRTPSIKG